MRMFHVIRIPLRGLVTSLILLVMGIPSMLMGLPSFNIQGTGLISDYQLERNMKMVFQDLEDGEFDASHLMDAWILLESTINDRGFLNADMVMRIVSDRGNVRNFETSDSLLEVLEIFPGEELVEVVFEIDQGDRTTFEEVQFTGDLPISEKEARGFFYPQDLLLPLARYRIYSDKILTRGLGNLAQAMVNLGYREAEARVTDKRVDQDENRVSLVIEVDPGPFYYVEGLVHGWEKTGGDDAAEALSEIREPDWFEEGAAWTPELERNLRLAYENAIQSLGYAEAQVNLEVIDGKVTEGDEEIAQGKKPVTIEVLANRGELHRVRELKITGVNHTRKPLVMREIPLGPGDLLVPPQLDDSRRNLYRLGVMDSVRATMGEAVKEGGNGVLRDVNFQIKEAPRREFTLRGGFGSYEKIRGGVGVEYKNLFGLAHRVQANAKGSLRSSSLGVDYTIPRLWNFPMVTTVSAEWLNREEVSFDREEWILNFGINGSAKPLKARYHAGYSIKSLNTRNIDSDTLLGDRDFRSGGVNFGLVRDARNNPVLPTQGFRWRANLDWVSPVFGAESNFQKFRFSATRHWEWGGVQMHAGLNHQALFSLGDSPLLIPVNARLFPGGENTVRGFGEGKASPRGEDGEVIGALHTTVANIEMEQPLTPNFNLVIFYDGLLQGVDESQYPGDEYLSSVGIGLRFLTPLGPVRLEYGRNIDPRPEDERGSLHFSLGFPF